MTTETERNKGRNDQAARSAERVRPAERVRGACAYRRGSTDGVDLWLDANEGPAMPDSLLQEILNAEPSTIRCYPDPSIAEARIAERWGCSASRVVLTNGGDDAIDRVCRCTLEPGRKVVLHEPSFEMIRRSAVLAGARADVVRWLDGSFPTAEIISRIDKNTGLVVLVTPNNPTGRVIPTAELIQVATAARRVGAAVLVDLAYAEFADEDPTLELLKFKNVVVVRTFSKAWGMAGLRVGYAIAADPVSDWIRAAGGPFAASGLAARAVVLALEACNGTEDYVKKSVARVRRNRTRLAALLQELGTDPIESQANFVLVRPPDAAAFVTRLRASGIAVRSFRGIDSLENWIRITVPSNDADFERLEKSLRNTNGALR